MLLYIHIPFCRRICGYCDFYHTTCLDRYHSFITKLVNDISTSEYCGQRIETIYFGGGTPSLLKEIDIRTIFETIAKTFTTNSVKEITMECNPDDLTEQYCDFLKETGINRLSIGIQSFNDRHLKIMNRRHNKQEAINAVKNAQKAGIENITIDLIYGLPFMSKNEWKYNLDTVSELSVQHISAYHLTIEEGTIFSKMQMQPVSDEVSELHYNMLRETLTENGFIQYEISNFSKKGYESIHNSGYWTGEPYLGFGPSAHSFDGSFHRWWQPSDLSRWLCGENTEHEFITMEERQEEIIMTSLRTVSGLKTTDTVILEKAEQYIKQGFMEYKDSRLRIRPEYFLVSDYIISQLI